MTRLRPAILIAAILAAALCRLLPHPPNFTPIAAMGLFGGAYLSNRWLGLLAPLAALLISDLILGFYSGIEVVYLATAMAAALGWLLREKRSPLRIVGAAVVSSVLFFLVSNLGTWATSGMYPHSLAGLQACFVAAIPFFQNSLAGDLVFTALLFGGFALAERGVPALRELQAALA